LQLLTALTDETGTGANVFATSPTLVTPALGTPSSGVVTNLTGTASININGTVGATTASTGAFTTVTTTGNITPALSSNYAAATLNRPSIRPSLLLDFANTRLLDPRITFARASTATFYDPTSTALAEQNLFLWSQGNFATWTPVEAITLTESATTAPDGTSTATSFVPAVATSIHRIRRSISLTSGNQYTISIYAKANTYKYLFINNTYLRATFDVSAGTVTATSAGTASITSVGSGWYRCIITGTASATAADLFLFQVNVTSSAAADDTSAGDGTSGL
jgi:hypothetical protein